MEKNHELKRYNIKPIRKLNNEEIEYIAETATRKMETMIPEFSGANMYEKLKNANIYLADIPEKYTKVNYIVSTNSIYIRGEENIKKIDEIMFHEIFHYIQCVKDNQGEGMPERMGLCRFKEYRIKGLALNEAAIQLIISMLFENFISFTPSWNRACGAPGCGGNGRWRSPSLPVRSCILPRTAPSGWTPSRCRSLSSPCGVVPPGTGTARPARAARAAKTLMWKI